MLNPEYLEHLPDEAVKLWQQVEDDILRDIGRRISKAGDLTDGAEWQLWRLEQTKALSKDVTKILSQYSGKNEKIIRKLLVEAGTQSLAEEDKIHSKAGKTITPINNSPALINLLNSGYKQTMGTWKNLTATTANTVTKQFENALDRAWLQLSSGAFDYQTAIKRTIDDLADNIKTIVYPSGHKDSLEVAVRRAVLTGVNQTAGKLSLERCNQMNCDLVETTAHAGARPDHAEWQGKVFSRSGKHPKYPPFSRTGYGTGAGLCGWNCRHSFYPFYEGLSKPGYTADELEKLNEKKIEYNGQQYSRYELSQMQRALERRVRKYKRRYVAENAAGVDTTSTAVKLKQSRQQLKEFAYAINNRVDTARTGTVGFGRSEAGKATYQAKRGLWLKDINNILNDLREKGTINIKGTAVIPPAIPENISFNEHALGRLSERQISEKEALEFAKNAIIAFSQRKSSQHAYYSDKGFIVIDKDGVVGTVGLLDEGGKKIVEVIKDNGINKK